MQNAILLHGSCEKEEYFDDKYPSLSNSHWLPWLQKQLLIRGIHAEIPEMPDAYLPNYNKWAKKFEIFDINEETILVGHSCGGGFLLRWLTENKVKVGNVVLVAPWLDPERSKTVSFFKFKIDPNVIMRSSKLKVFVSSDDEDDVLVSVKQIQEAIPNIFVRRFQGLGHFTEGEMRRKDFPEILEELFN